MACKPIEAIIVKFRQHLLAEYQQAYNKLNTQYATLIADIDDFFNDNERVNNIPALVTSKLVESMDLPNKEDIAKVTQMFNSGAMTLRWHLHGQETYACLSNSDIAFSKAIKANKFLCLLVNINSLHFKDNFRANTFADSSTEPFSSGPATPAAPPANQTPNTPVTINDIASLIRVVLPGAIAQQTSPLGGNQMQQTGNIINPSLLPHEVQ